MAKGTAQCRQAEEDDLHARVERALGEWRAALDAVPDPVFLHDAKYRILRANRAYAQIAGVAFEEMIGRPYWAVFPRLGGPPQGCEGTVDGEHGGREEEFTLDDGRVFRSREFAVRDSNDTYLYSVHILEELTESRRAQNERLWYGQALEQAGAAMLLADAEGYIRYVNGSFEVLFGYPRDEIVGEHARALSVEEEPDVLQPGSLAAWAGEHGCWQGPVRRQASDGRAIPVHLAVAPIRDHEGCFIGYLATYLDLRTVEAARERTDALRTVIEDLSAELDIDELGRKAVAAAVRITGTDIGTVPLLESDGETLSHRWHVGVSDSEVESVRRRFNRREGLTREVIETGRTRIIHDYSAYEGALPEYARLGIKAVLIAPIWQGDALVGGLGVTSRQASYRFDQEDVACVEAIARQIGVALRREALSEDLVASEARHRRVVETVPDILYEADPADFHAIYVSPAATDLLGYQANELLGDPSLWERLLHRDDHDRVIVELRAAIAAQCRELVTEYRIQTRDGHVRWFEDRVRIEYNGRGRAIRVFGVMSDVTSRKRAERAYRTLSSANQSVLRASDEQALLDDVCRTVVEEGGYALAWVGYAEHDADKRVRPVARAGQDEGYVDGLDITWADSERGQGPTGTSIRTGRTVGARDIDSASGFEPWRAAAEAQGFGSSLAIPLTRDDGTAFGALNIYAAEPNAFDNQETGLLEEMAADLAYGIMALHTGHRVARTERQLRDALNGTVRAIARMVEQRDPYTAGHQRRVAELAVAIAQVMGLDEERVEGIRMGAWIHDIGKMAVPAEVLTRPGRLKPAEFDLIKVHPEAGDEIIGDVEFPWPIGAIIREHHERFDGSGYPRGLAGEEIQLEARIVAVADVVEAMATHRPYRPARGIEHALDHVEQHKGTSFDPHVVDACLELFRERGFELPKVSE